MDANNAQANTKKKLELKKLVTDINELNPDQIQENLDAILEENPNPTQQTMSQGIATKQEVDKVIKKIMVEKNMPLTQDIYNRVYVTVCHLLQIGATSPKFAESRKILDYNVDFKAGDLKYACKYVGITVRKLGRGMKDEVVKVAKKHNLEGNLSKNYKLQNPDFDQQDLIWVSDFQTFSNDPSMPEKIKKWLLENYRTRFRPGNKVINDPNLE